MIKQIIEKYNLKEDDLLQKLDDESVIKRNNDFKENGFEYIKANYPLIFEGVGSNKIRKENTQKKKIKVRVEKYNQLKELWEKLNEKVVLEYKIENENKFKELFIDFLRNNTFFSAEGMQEKKVRIGIENNQAIANEEIAIFNNEMTPISTMKYEDFLKQLSSALNINLKTIHECFVKINTEINKYFNQSTLRIFKQKFDNYLMYKALNKFSIEYQKVKSEVHPTKMTDINGNVKNEVDASGIGVFRSDEKVANDYLFDELFYDSEIEKDNIKTEISEVVVFTKIPKNSIKIPVAGGKSYSPDFAYVINFKNGNRKLYFVVETKGVDYGESLKPEEVKKIEHAKKFFGDTVQIEFKTQFSNKKVTSLIQEIYN